MNQEIGVDKFRKHVVMLNCTYAFIFFRVWQIHSKKGLFLAVFNTYLFAKFNFLVFDPFFKDWVIDVNSLTHSQPLKVSFPLLKVVCNQLYIRLMAKDIPKDPSKSLLAHLTGELGIDPLSAQLCHFEEIYFNNLNSFACFINVE